MAQKINKVERFWLELKRRKVFKVVAMYAGTAFIIIQLVDTLTNPLHLALWIATLVVILLSIGFPIVAVLAWIFDLTPEGLKKTESLEELAGKEIVTTPARRRLKASDIIIAVLAVIVLVLIYPEIFQRDSLKKLRASDGRIPLAIMPFQNMSNDSTLNYLKEWIPESVTSYLSNYSEDLEVRQTESIYSMIKNQGLANNASITPSVASLISQKLDANIIISGSLTKTGTGIIINANLINSKTEEVLKSFKEEGNPDEIIPKIDTLSQKIKDYLIVSRMKKKLNPEVQHLVSTSSPEALKHYILGQDAQRDFYYNPDYSYTLAHEEFLKAIGIDSNFTVAYFGLISTYENKLLYDSAKIYCLHLYDRRDQMTPQLKLRTELIYSRLFEMPYDCIKYLKQLLELDDRQPGVYFSLGCYYNYWKELNQQDKEIPAFEKSLEIYNKWGTKPPLELYTRLGDAYRETKQNKKAEKLFNKAEQDFPDNLDISWNKFRLFLAVKDTGAANDYLKKFITLAKDNSVSESYIARGIADAYWCEANYEKPDSAEYLNKAEEYFRKAVTLAPDNSEMIGDFAWFLIDLDRNIKEGLEIVEKELELNPDDYANLDSKGWGLYKQGKYKEALAILQKADTLKPIYRSEIPFHIQEVKKALASQKNN